MNWEDLKKFIVYEDDSILVINKPIGISVVGDSNEKDIVKIAKDNGLNLSPVHRIDKETSGGVLFAKNPKVHAELTRQFNKQSVDKYYLVITDSVGLPSSGEINLPLSLGRKNKVRVAALRKDILFNKQNNTWGVKDEKIFSKEKNYPSVTKFVKIIENDKNTLLLVRPITGRTHQIRIHFAWIGHKIKGDPLFWIKGERMHLHSWKLIFQLNNMPVEVEAEPDKTFWLPVKDILKDQNPITLISSFTSLL